MPAHRDLAALTAIPNVGAKIARKLLALGARRLDDLRGSDA
jgi:Holliday junction resolvasome RuvABC DNA-binding subunit